MKLACLASCLALLVAAASPAGEPPLPRQKLPAASKLMRDVHMRGRMVYRSLDQLLISGRSTADERKRFADGYAALRELAPPQGTAESWHHDIDRILGLVRDMDAAKDEAAMLAAGTSLWYAADCRACHEKYRYTPQPAEGEVVPKSVEVARKAVAAGGKQWSAPEKLEKLGLMQPGRRLLVWPAEVKTFPQADGAAIVQAQFNWVLLPGAEIPDGSPERFYYHYYFDNDPKLTNFQFTAPHGGAKAREGTFTLGFDLPKGGQEVALVLVSNWTGPVPLGNFVVLKR